MKTEIKLEKSEILYKQENGKLSPFATVPRNYSNYDIVVKMAELGSEAAKKSLVKLNKISSRERSESGIYYKLRELPEWVQAIEAMTGKKLPQPLRVIYESQTKKTPARIDLFNTASVWFGNNKVNEGINHTRTYYGVSIDINVTIKPISHTEAKTNL